MARGKRRAESKEMVALAAEIQLWRDTRKQAGPMPAELWRKATALGEKLGVGATVRALGLGHATLKARVKASSSGASPTRPRRETARFIEVTGAPAPVRPLQAPAVDDSLAVELAGSSGQRLTVRLSSLAQLEGVMPLVMQCWERQR